MFRHICLLAALPALAGCSATPPPASPEEFRREVRIGMPEARFLQAFPDAQRIASEPRGMAYHAALPQGCDFCAHVGGYLHLLSAREATFQFEDGRLARALTTNGEALPLRPRLGPYAGQLQTRGRPHTWWW